MDAAGRDETRHPGDAKTRMRTGRRDPMMTRAVALLGALAMAAAPYPIPASARDLAQASAVEPASRMTIELDWAAPPPPVPAPARPAGVELRVGGGRVVEVVATSPDA